LINILIKTGAGTGQSVQWPGNMMDDREWGLISRGVWDFLSSPLQPANESRTPFHRA